MVHLMKYKGKRSIGLRLGSMLAAALRRDPRFGHVDLLVPVPLHRVRLKERGYNQSELLAQALGEMLDKPMRTDLLARTRYTSDQTKLDVYQRRANVAGAFRVKDERQIAGRDVALVDDVLTTGATLEACGETLFAAGARSVSVLTVASPFAEW
jgi:ComF family protein